MLVEAGDARARTAAVDTPGARARPRRRDRVPTAEELVELSIADLAAKLASGAETTVSLVDKYRRRIAAMNEQGPMLRAVLELDREADVRTRAATLDAERAAGKLRGPLHGIPILVKDNIDDGGHG